MSGSPQAKNFTPRLTSPEAVAALQHMVDCVKASTPGVLSYDFTASTNAFSAGKTAMMLMWSTIAGPVYNPKTSKVAKTVGVATSPGVGERQGKIVRGGWGIGIPKNAQNKDGAWALITYLTSKEWGKFEVEAHQTDPTRNSVFNDPALNKKFPYLRTAGQANQRAQILEIANIPETFELITERRHAVRRGARRIVLGARTRARPRTTAGSRSSSAAATSRSDPARPLTEPSAVSDRVTKRTLASPLKRRGEGLLLLGPCALYLVVFSIYPLVASLVRSFQRYDQVHQTWHWIGLGNYRELFSEPAFRTIVENTLKLMIAGVAIQVVAGRRARALLQPEPARRGHRQRAS